MTSAPRRILITGANGFVGGWLRRELARRGDAVTVIAAGRGGSDCIQADIADAGAVTALVRDARPDAVVHLAAIAAPVEASAEPRTAWSVNVMGTLNLAQAVLAEAPEAIFVNVGSAEVYGDAFAEAGGRPLAEDARLEPVNAYGATKAAADLMIGQMVRDGLRAIRFRPFNHTGPGQNDSFVVPAFARQVAGIMAGRAEPVIHVGNLAACRDFLDVRDVVCAYASAALSDGTAAGGIFNLASGRALRIGDMLDSLIAMAGRPIEIRTDPDRLRPVDIPVAVGDAGAALRAFGWKPEIDFAQTLRDVLEDWRQRGATSPTADLPT